MKPFTLLLLTVLLACAPTTKTEDAGSVAQGDAGRACDHISVDASLSCVAPCSVGNEKGVGAWCTPGGGQCESPAFICTGDGSPGTKDLFCTLPCSTDTQCGTGARCMGDPALDGGGSKGCVPTACQ